MPISIDRRSHDHRSHEDRSWHRMTPGQDATADMLRCSITQ